MCCERYNASRMTPRITAHLHKMCVSGAGRGYVDDGHGGEGGDGDGGGG